MENKEQLTEEQLVLANKQHSFDEVLITFETAKLAAEKGFDHPKVLNAFNKNGEEAAFTWDLKYGYERKSASGYLRPTQNMLQRWLREVFNIHINYNYQESENNHRFNTFDGRIKEYGIAEVYFTYEEGLERELLEGLKLIQLV